MASGESLTKSDSCSFDELCQGANGYVCDPSCLVDLLEADKSTPIPTATKSIKDKLDSIVRVLEIRRRGSVKILHIGKACIEKRKKAGGEYHPLDRMDPATWIRGRIGSHWRGHRSKGRDGMIVLTAITKETTPDSNGINQYALELQQNLAEIYKTGTKISEKNKKESLDGYVLYAAFNIEWTRFDVPAANMSTNTINSSFGFEATDNDKDEDEDDMQHDEPSHVPVIVDNKDAIDKDMNNKGNNGDNNEDNSKGNNEDSHPLVKRDLTLVISQQVSNTVIPLVIPLTSHLPTSKQSHTNTTGNTTETTRTSLEGKRSLSNGCQDIDLPPTKIQKVFPEKDQIDSPLSVTTSVTTVETSPATRKPYKSLVGTAAVARPKKSSIKISLSADPTKVPSLSKNKLTQGLYYVPFPPTCPPIPAAEIPPLTPLSPNEGVTPSLDAMAVLPTSIPYTNPPDAALFDSPPSPPATPRVPTNVTESPSRSVAFNIPNTESPSSVAPSVTFSIPNMATLSPTGAMPPIQQSSQQRPASVASRTTLGGCTFEDLCNQPDLRNYVCDPSCLVDLSKTDSVDEVVRLLAEKLEDNIWELEIARGKVTKIYIGKTFIKQRRKRGGGFQQFDPMQPTTWKKNGISSRWGDHKSNGKDGLIVLTAVTRKTAPKGFTQQDYALMLEQKLIHRYKLNNDVRLENETSGEGARTKNLTRGYAVYVAFIIEANNEEIDEDNVILLDDDMDHEEVGEGGVFFD